MENQKETMFITGIAGFIGFHLASSLIKKEYYVIGCDNFNHYYSPDLKKMRADKLISQGAKIINEDIQNLSSIPKNVTHIIHLAAQAGVRYSLTHPKPYIDSNLNGFLNILELCKDRPDIKLIFASSSSVYGSNTKIPFSEGDVTDSPVSLYAATKKGGELLAKSYHHLYNIPMVGLRFFTVYGPWGRPDMAYYSFAEKIMREEPLPLYNHGKMERDFTYIDDIVDGIVATLDHPEGFEIYNLGNNRPEPLMRLVELLEKYLGKKAHLTYKPMQKGDVTSTYADITKANQAFGYAPKTSLDQGIAQFSSWFLERVSPCLESSPY